MIAFIKGIVAYKDAESAIIEAGGIGYELAMSVHALATLPACGNPAQVWTYLHVKEDDVSLFGFSEPAERELFEKLIAVSGIGPKMAISALSTFKPADFVAHIAAGDRHRHIDHPRCWQENRATHDSRASGGSQNKRHLRDSRA